MCGVFSTHGKDEKCLNILGGKPEGNSQLGRPRRRREEILGLPGIGCEIIEWLYLVQDRDK